jgi:hypothetical protein
VNRNITFPDAGTVIASRRFVVSIAVSDVAASPVWALVSVTTPSSSVAPPPPPTAVTVPELLT